MNQEQIQKLIDNSIANSNLTVGSLSVSSHTHNGVDSPRIPIQNIIIVPDIGLPLYNGIYGYNFYIDSGLSNLILEPNQAVIDAGNAVFYIGESPDNLFDNVYINTSDDIEFSANNGIQNNLFKIDSTTGTTNTYTDIETATESLNANLKSYTATGNFALQLATSAGTPTAVAGGIYYDGSTFWFCADGINWVALTLP